MISRILKKILNPRDWLRALRKLSPKKVFARAKRAGIKQVMGAIAAYLGVACASTYLVTALLTPASLIRPREVLNVVERAGIVNTLTCGVGAPVVAGVQGVCGAVMDGLGRLTSNTVASKTAATFRSKADAYFKEGFGIFDASGTLTETGKIATFNPAAWLGMMPSLDLGENPRPDSSAGEVAPVNNADEGEVASKDYHWTEFDPDKYPNYYRIIEGHVSIDYSIKAGNVHYDGKDALGRTGRAVANITADMVAESAGWRASFASDADTISGWGHNFKASVTLPNGKSYNGYFWNRSHLIADSLGGYNHVYNANGVLDKDASKSEAQNLICGTRMQNVGTNNAGGSGYGGMAYFERMVVDYLESHPDCSVWYSATPLYEGDELVPRSVLMEIKSCDGGIDVVAEVFNAANASEYKIDYMTGEVTDLKSGEVH